MADKSDNTISAADICHLRTWCIKPTHPPDEPCLEVPRRTLPPSDFGPEQAKRRRY